VLCAPSASTERGWAKKPLRLLPLLCGEISPPGVCSYLGVSKTGVAKTTASKIPNKPKAMRKLNILFLLTAGILSARAQDFVSLKTEDETQEKIQKKKTLPINISYFGETLIHPGIEIGYENNFFKSFHYTVSIGSYIHQRNHAALFLSGGLNWRHTFSFGWSPEVGIGFGYLHIWEAGGPTYVVDKDGKVSQKTRWGRSHIMPSAQFGLLGEENNECPVKA